MSLMRKPSGEKAVGEITSRPSGKTSLIGFRKGRQNKREVIDVQFLKVTISACTITGHLRNIAPCSIFVS
jgi:hypothetical protein